MLKRLKARGTSRDIELRDQFVFTSAAIRKLIPAVLPIAINTGNIKMHIRDIDYSFGIHATLRTTRKNITGHSKFLP